MKISIKFLTVTALAFAFIVMQACSFSTANLSSLKTSTDKDGKTEASAFKTGDTLNAQAQVSNNPGKVKVKFTLVAEDVKGMTKGDALKGADVSVDIDGDGIATYTLPVSMGVPAGTYKLNADMLNDKGEKKDSKSANITVTQTAPPAAPKGEEDDDDKDADDKGHK
jgi:hypothetical protein